MSQFTDPEHAHSALITIDVQCDPLDGEAFEIPGTSAILPRIGRLAAVFRSRVAPIVHVVRLYLPDDSNVDPCRRELVHQGVRRVLTERTNRAAKQLYSSLGGFEPPDETVMFSFLLDEA